MRSRSYKAIGCKEQSRTDQPARSRAWPIRWTLLHLGCEPRIAGQSDSGPCQTDQSGETRAHRQPDGLMSAAEYGPFLSQAVGFRPKVCMSSTRPVSSFSSRVILGWVTKMLLPL